MIKTIFALLIAAGSAWAQQPLPTVCNTWNPAFMNSTGYYSCRVVSGQVVWSKIIDVPAQGTFLYLPRSVSDLRNDLNFLPQGANVSLLNNDAQYLTAAALTPYAKLASLATVATSDNYTDLQNKPTIPTALSQLTNDIGFVTSAQAAALLTAANATPASSAPLLLAASGQGFSIKGAAAPYVPALALNPQVKTGAYSVQDSDQGSLLIATGTAPTFAIGAISASQFAKGFTVELCNQSAASIVVGLTSGVTVNGGAASQFAIASGHAVIAISDGATNWTVIGGFACSGSSF